MRVGSAQTLHDKHVAKKDESMIRATTGALAVVCAAWAAVGCARGAEDDSVGPTTAPDSGAGGNHQSVGGSGGTSPGNGGLGGSGGSAGNPGAGGGSGGVGGSPQATGGSGGTPPPGIQQGTSTVDEEMIPPEPVYDDTGAIYVSTAGNDTAGDGSMNAPLRTIAQALSVGGAGALIVLRGTPYLGAGANVYVGEARIRNPGVTLRSATGEWAVIQCGTDSSAPGSCVDFDVDASDGKLQRVEVIGGFYYGVAFETKWDWGEPDRSGASRVLVEDCKIHGTGRDAVKVKPGCDDIVIRRTEIYNSGAGYAAGATDKNAEGIDNVNGDRMVVQDSYIHDTATNGIYFKGGATDCVIERNRVERTGGGGILSGFDTSPEYFDLGTNPGYYESIRGILRNNLVTDTAGDGIGMYAAKDPLIFNNTVVNTASAFHSPLYFGITFQDWDSTAARPPTVNPTLANNVVVQPTAAAIVGIRWSSELGGLSGLDGSPDMNHNLYSCTAGACTFDDSRPTTPLDNGSFSQWQQHIANEGNSLTANPALDATGHLGSGSPCIDAGRTVPQVKLDIDRQPRNGVYDLGADEVVSSP